jgi:hypothetical protein
MPLIWIGRDGNVFMEKDTIKLRANLKVDAEVIE